MIVNLQQGYPDKIGRRFAWMGSGIGPTSYLRSTGDAIQAFGFQQYIDVVFGGIQSVSGTYVAYPRPNGAGPRAAWALHYFVVSSGAEVADAVNLSAETFIVSGLGGTY